MHSVNIRKLADRIAEAYSFDMCDSMLCVGGYAKELVQRGPVYLTCEDALMKYCNLDSITANMIVYAARDKEGNRIHLDNVTQDMAVAMLRRLADTGKAYYDVGEKK